MYDSDPLDEKEDSYTNIITLFLFINLSLFIIIPLIIVNTGPPNPILELIEKISEDLNETCLAFGCYEEDYSVCPTNETSECCSGHGVYWFSKCYCDYGWVGEECEINYLPNGNCSEIDCGDENNFCYNGICICHPKFYWSDEESKTDCSLTRRDLSLCENDVECLNGGKCVKYNFDPGECYCPYGTSGPNCQYL